MRSTKSRPNKPAHCYRTQRAKIRYRTLKDAKTARSSRAEDAGYLRIYKCECGGFHLTAAKPHTQNNTVWRDKNNVYDHQ